MSTEIVTIPRGEVSKADFTPLFTVEEAIERKKQIGQIIAGVLEEGMDRDYSKLPGGSTKKILLKPGAEKLSSMFGLTPRYIAEVETEDWTGKHHGEPFFYYRYRCQLFRGDRLLGEAIGSCNSWETKYRYRWLTAEECAMRDIPTDGLPCRGGLQVLTEPDFAIEKAETGGKYGKPAEHWQRFKDAIAAGTAVKGEKAKKAGGMMPTWSISVDAKLFRIPNPDIADVVNTVQKIGQKRAFVATVLVATNASDSFTQDLEDFSDIDTGGHEVGTQAAADYVRDQKLAKSQPVPASPPAGNGSGASSVPPSAGPTATGPSPAPEPHVPDELKPYWPDLQTTATARAALHAMRQAISKALPKSGEVEYRRLIDKHGIQKPHLLDELKKCLLEMHYLARWAEQNGNKTPPGEPPNNHEQLFDDGPKQEVMYGD